MVPTVTGPLTLTGRVHASEARVARAHTRRKLKFTLPGPMTIIDTIADAYYGDRVKMAFAFADLLNAEARALAADGVDVIQFDEPAFNVYMDEVKDWGIEALHRATAGLSCTTAVHICYGYGIQANVDWKATLGGAWRQYEEIFPALAASRIDQVSLECRNSKVPLELLALLGGKDVILGAIDVASDTVETPEDVAAVIGAAMRYVPRERIIPCTNCGMAPMRRDIAVAKLNALGAGARLARERFGSERVHSPLPARGRGWGAEEVPPALRTSGEGARLAPSAATAYCCAPPLFPPQRAPKVPFDQILRADVQRARRGPRGPGGAAVHPGGARMGADRRAEPRRPVVFRLHSRAL